MEHDARKKELVDAILHEGFILKDERGEYIVNPSVKQLHDLLASSDLRGQDLQMQGSEKSF